MTNELKFESEAGQNIKLSKDHKEATWTPIQSDGWAYSARAMAPGETIVFELEGSGHCQVGFTIEQTEANGACAQMFKMTKLNDIRLHKRACKINLTLQDNAKEVFSVFEGKRFSKKASKDSQVKAAAYVKFGTVSMTLHSNRERLQFSNDHGSNIRLEDNNRNALTISNNPAAICVFNIKVGETILMHCSPITEGSRDPSRYHLNLQVANIPATELKRQCPSMFETCADQTSQSSLTSLETLEKETCKGTISLALAANNMLAYTTSHGKKNEQKLQATSSRHVWIVLELYRVSVKLLEKTENVNYSTNMLGTNEVDSRMRDPSNYNTETSLDDNSTHSRVAAQPYVSVTEAKQIMNSRNAQVSNGYRSAYTTDSDILERLDRIEDKQEEILQLVQGNLSPPKNKSPSHTLHSIVEQDGLLLTDLQLHWVDLINNMRVDSLCDHLYQQNIIDENDMHRILSLNKDDQRDANRKLLTILVKKHVRKPVLSKILDDAQESHLKPLFFPYDFKKF